MIDDSLIGQPGALFERPTVETNRLALRQTILDPSGLLAMMYHA
jgi:hypothetical protein